MADITAFPIPTVTLTKTSIGLGNADNTSDINKPVSTAQQAAIDLKIDASTKGQANGLASLDAAQKLPVANMPQYLSSFATRIGDVVPATGDYSQKQIKTIHDVTLVEGFFGIDNTGIYWDDGV